jgi:hypothetical protein
MGFYTVVATLLALFMALAVTLTRPRRQYFFGWLMDIVELNTTTVIHLIGDYFVTITFTVYLLSFYFLWFSGHRCSTSFLISGINS